MNVTMVSQKKVFYKAYSHQAKEKKSKEKLIE